MKKAYALLLTCTLLICSIQLFGVTCKPIDSTQLKACLTSNATNIQIKADITVNLTGFSLEGVTIDIGSRTLIITGNPTVNSSTVFNSSGGSGTLILVTPSDTFTFKENTAQGGVDLNFLNMTFLSPYFAQNLLEALGMALILPVGWLDFMVRLDAESVLLEWTTATELNNDKFIIESSSNGELFHPIGQLKGAGTSSEGKRYRFVHRNPSAGTNYYRLKQVDFDGTYDYSKVMAIDAPGTSALLAFPNPVKDRLNLQYDYQQGPGQIQLFDALGRRIAVNINGEVGNYEIQLPSDLPKGAYWLKVVRMGTVQTVTVMKE